MAAAAAVNRLRNDDEGGGMIEYVTVRDDELTEIETERLRRILKPITDDLSTAFNKHMIEILSVYTPGFTLIYKENPVKDPHNSARLSRTAMAVGYGPASSFWSVDMKISPSLNVDGAFSVDAGCIHLNKSWDVRSRSIDSDNKPFFFLLHVGDDYKELMRI